MTMLILLIITILGTILRLINISPFKLYPDSYQNLIVAENIQKYHSVLGTLGTNGYLYPPYFGWARIGYAILIDITNLITKDSAQSGNIISFLAGIIAIILSFYLITLIFNSKPAGLAASFLLAISFSHIVWGGFILTETTGVCMLLLTCLTFFNAPKFKAQLANKFDLLTGVLFAFAVFTRFEYILLIFPMIIYLLLQKENIFLRISTIFSTFLFVTILITTQFYPIADSLQALISQNRSITLITIFLLVIFFAFVILNKYLKIHFNTSLYKYSSYVIVFSLWIISTYVFLQIIFPTYFTYLNFELSALRDFIHFDFLIYLLAILGLTKMLFNKNYFSLAFFSIVGIILFATVYYQVNPAMERYWTHSLPFLLIPSSYILNNLYNKLRHISKKKLNIIEISLILIIFLLIIYQIIISERGMKYWNNGEWFKTSYEEKSAKILSSKINQNVLIISSIPEAYYYYTHISTQSIADIPPYLYLENTPDDQQIIIVEDIGMRDLFPRFSAFLDKHFQLKEIDQYYTGGIYHWGIKSIPENKPVIIYQSTLADLKESIKDAK